MKDPGITICSGMSGFVLIDRIIEIGPDKIMAGKAMKRAPIFSGIEALAQAGALHTRYLNDFDRHAFLLKIQRCSLPPGRELDGEFLIRGVLAGRSAASFLYRLCLEKNGWPAMEGEFLIGTVAYDFRFPRGILEKRYRDLFACLIDTKPLPSRMLP
ncbi:MAG TPA: hypothetical protein DCG53_06930 [Syntrophus sp. (in: bacteria)]|jgi:hypothetical protein|nr:hypothetical protein [Syntrophus sp. (in: bacteria)]